MSDDPIASALVQRELDRLAKQRSEIERAILAIVSEWASLENSLALLLGACLDSPFGIALPIYYAPSNTETRIKIVDAAFRHRFSTPAGHEHVMPLWETFLLRLGRNKDARNSAIHGQIATVFINGRNHVRHTPLMWDFERHRKGIKPRQLPGKSGADLKGCAEALRARCGDADLFSRLLSAPATSPQTFRELEARLKKAAPPQGGPTPAAPDDPHQSSGA
jgi:hypothetical protein